MSNSAWLSAQRKTDLSVLADEAGLRGSSNMRKDELVAQLEKTITANAQKLRNNSAFDAYFKGDTGASSEPEAKPKAKRRATKAASELTDIAPERIAAAAKEAKEIVANASSQVASSASAAVNKTPKAASKAANKVLPASPSAVTDMVERQAAVASRRLQHYWESTGLQVHAETARETISSVIGVYALGLALEVYGLQRAVLPWRYAFTVPGLKLTDPLRITAPDFFVLVTSAFWGPVTLWLFTSLLLPALAGYFVNLTIHAGRRKLYAVDPLVFGLAKALIAYLVYGQGFRAGGLADLATALRVDVSVPGGWFGIVIGSLVGVVASLYEAVLRK